MTVFGIIYVIVSAFSFKGFVYNEVMVESPVEGISGGVSVVLLIIVYLPLAGYIKINEGQAQTDIHDEGALELEKIYVSKEVQENGIGSYMMEQTVVIAKQKEKKYIWLGVWEKNDKAISFYQKHGFYKIGTHEFVIGEDIQTDYIMRRDL